MNRRQIFHFVLAAALIGVPAAAQAQYSGGARTVAVLDRNECARIVREQQRDRDRDRNDREERRLARECEREYGNLGTGYGYGYGNGARAARLSGIISSFSPYNLYLERGTHVELHRGTVINPTGTSLRSGMRVSIVGNWNADGTFNANEIDVANRRY